MAAVAQKDTERLWSRAFTGRPGVVGWCVRLPEGLNCFFVSVLDGASTFLTVLSSFVFHCLLLVSLCWMVCLSSRGSCFPLLTAFSRVLSSPVCYCFPTCVLVLDCVSALDGWCVCPCRHCPPFSPSAFLFPIVSHCLPTCVPLFDGVLCPPP